MSRRQERKASRHGLPRYDNLIWYDLCVTYHRATHAFEKGCGQETMRYWVRHATGRWWPSHHIRRTLRAAVECGWAEYITTQPGKYRISCTRFRINVFRPLPGDPKYPLKKW